MSHIEGMPIATPRHGAARRSGNNDATIRATRVARRKFVLPDAILPRTSTGTREMFVVQVVVDLPTAAACTPTKATAANRGPGATPGGVSP